MPTIDGIVVDGQTIDTIVMPNGEEISVGGVTPEGTKTITQNGITDVTNYAKADVQVFPSLQKKSITITPSPLASVGTIITADALEYDGLSEVEVTVPRIEWGAEGTPTATKGTVSNHSVSVTPSVTNTAGYIPGSTKTGTPVTVSASELVSGTKSITQNGTGIDVTNYASVDVAVPSSAPTLQTKTKTYTPTETAQTESVTADSGFDGIDTVNVTVNAVPSTYVGSGITRRSSSDLTASGATVSVPSGFYENNASKAVASGTLDYFEFGVEDDMSISVSESGLITAVVSMESTTEPVVASGYLDANTVCGLEISGEKTYQLQTQSATTITPTTSSQTAVAAGKYTTGEVTVAAMPSGTAGTPTATKSAVSNHSVSVTPSVTNTTGYINGGTKTGTAVTVSASELVSGSQTLSDNGTYDVTNLAEVVVDVQGGGGGGTQVATKTATPSTAASSIQFTSLSGNPTSFVVTSQADIATNTNGVTAVVFDGSSLHGQTMTTQVTADTGFTKSYSNGTLTITATSAYFEANAYKLVYTYGGSTSDIETADVQVGSGATSITFSVNGRPAYWSCIFKSDFSTSSGYQRVIAVANDGSSTYGLAMDSSAHAATSWTASYSGGNFTINSQSTNNGGYFHQPGYYQLTYYVDPSAPSYQSKTVTPTTSTQNVTADSGYDALSQVTVNPIPSQYIIPTGNLPITQNGNNINVSQYATVSVNVSGGGGDEKNTQVVQGTTRTTSSSMTAIGAEMTVSKTGTYDIYWSGFRSSTSSSYTYATQLYIDNTAYGSENSTWSNHVQNNHLSSVSLTLNQKLRVRGRNSRGSSYYIYAPTLVIVEK